MRNRTPSGVSAAPVIASSPSTDLKRRRFLFSLGAGGAAAVSAAAMPTASVAQAATAETNDTGSGYRETQHVRDYYRTAKL
jgi:hypothetical protein